MWRAGIGESDMNATSAHDLMDKDETCRFFGGNRPINAATLYRGVQAGRYPKPVKVGPNTSRWLRSECVGALTAACGRPVQLECATGVASLSAPSALLVEAPKTEPFNEALQTSLPMERMPANVAGVYFLFFNDKLLYVGGSADILFRVGQHVRSGSIPFTHYAIRPCAIRLIAEIEERYIKAWRPPYNAAGASGYSAKINVSIREMKDATR